MVEGLDVTTVVLVAKSQRIEDFLRDASGCGLLSGQSQKGNLINLDELLGLVSKYNCVTGTKVDLGHLMEGTEVVERQQQIANCRISELEMMRLRAAESSYQRSIQKIRNLKEVNDQQTGVAYLDSFAHSRISLLMGINFSLGLFLTFFAGYWLAAYTGIGKSTSAKCIVGMVFSFVTLLVEVFLIILHDERATWQLTKSEKQCKKRSAKFVEGAGAEQADDVDLGLLTTEVPKATKPTLRLRSQKTSN